MKKVYLLAGALAAGFAVNAQYNHTSLSAKQDRGFNNATKKKESALKSEGDQLWSDDMSTASNWTISNAGAAASPPHTAGDWAIVNAMPASLTSQIPNYGFPGAMNSASGGNFALIDSDAAGGSATQNAYLTTTADINLATLLTNNGSPTNTTVYLQFTEIYRNFYDETWVQISIDGGATWVDFEVNPEAEVPVNTNSADPEYESVNITSAIGAGNWTDQVRVRFHYMGAWDWFWGIDDVKIVEAWDNDVRVSTFHTETPVGTQELDYFLVNQSQASFPGLTFGARVGNNGSLAQTGVALNATCAAASYDETGTALALPIGGTDSVSVEVPFMVPSNNGSYDVDLTTELTGATDSDNVNNVKTLTVTRDPWLYSRDDGNRISAIANVTSQDQQALKIGNVMEVFDNTDITFMQIRLIDQSAAVGQQIFGEIHIFDGGTGEFVYLAETQPYTIVNGDLDNFVTLPIDGGSVSVSAGDVLLVMAAHFGGANEVAFGLAQTTEEGTVLGYTANGESFQLTTPNAVMVRVSDQPLSVNENNTDFSVNVYPNPAVNEAKVAFELQNASDVVVTVTDLAGKVVYSNNLGNTAAGKHTIDMNTAAFAGGIYTVNFSADNTVVTQKLVVKK